MTNLSISPVKPKSVEALDLISLVPSQHRPLLTARSFSVTLQHKEGHPVTSRQQSYAFVAKVGGRTVGVLLGAFPVDEVLPEEPYEHFDGPRVSWLYVVREHRRQKIATRLMEAAEGHLKEHGQRFFHAFFRKLVHDPDRPDEEPADPFESLLQSMQWGPSLDETMHVRGNPRTMVGICPARLIERAREGLSYLPWDEIPDDVLKEASSRLQKKGAVDDHRLLFTQFKEGDFTPGLSIGALHEGRLVGWILVNHRPPLHGKQYAHSRVMGVMPDFHYEGMRASVLLVGSYLLFQMLDRKGYEVFEWDTEIGHGPVSGMARLGKGKAARSALHITHSCSKCKRLI